MPSFLSLKNILKYLEISILLAGVIVANRALTHYKNATSEAANARLASLDRDAYNESLKNDNLNVIYIGFPPPNSVDEARQVAHKIINIALGNEFKNYTIEWNDIKDLHNYLYSIDNFYGEGKDILRKVSTHTDLIFYTVDAAFSTYQSCMISAEDYDTWKGYLREIGKNPLFFLSVYDAYKYAYITEDSCEEIRNTIMGDPTSLLMMRAVYPDMESPDWAQNIKKQGHQKGKAP